MSPEPTKEDAPFLWVEYGLTFHVSRDELAENMRASRRRRFGAIFWSRVLLAICILALASLPLFAHSWYDPACCGGNDCAPIPSITVTAGTDGWHVRLGPGDHPMVTRGVVDAVVPYDEALPSRDGAFHACVRDQSSPSNVMADPIICLYVPDLGSS